MPFFLAFTALINAAYATNVFPAAVGTDINTESPFSTRAIASFCGGYNSLIFR